MSQQARVYSKENFDIRTTVDQWSGLLSAASLSASQQVPGGPETRGVLVFWLIDNWESFHRREMIEALARNLDDDLEILVVEPGEDEQELIQRGWETEISLQQYANNQPQPVAPGIHKVRIITNTLLRKIGQSMHLSGYSQSKTGSRLDELVNSYYGQGTRILHWIYKPNQVERLCDGKKDRFIYEVYDDYTRDFESGELIKSVQLQEERICKLASHVFFTANTLEQRKSGFCTEFSTVSNGVNYDVFQTFRVDDSASTREGLRKSVGYLGNLSDFFDWDLMLQVVRKLPDIDFFFHGNIEHRKMGQKQAVIQELQNLSNAIFTGLVTRQQGAAAIARYDVLIIPFAVNKAMHAVNPLKLWEYFAAGKPVISSRMDATEHYSGVVNFADSVSQWCQYIEKLTSSEIEESVRNRQIELAKAHSWTELTVQHAHIVNAVFQQMTHD